MMITALILAVSACSPTPDIDLDQPVSSDDTPVPTVVPPSGEMEIHEMAGVDEVDVLLLESFPLQVNVVVKGNFPDGCTTIHRTETEFVENRFTVRIFTQRPADPMCTEALVPFEEVIPLDVYGLPAGIYTVDVYGTKSSFTFEQDNVLEEPGGG